MFLRCATFSISVLFVICPATSTGVEAFAGLGLLPWLQMVVPGRRSCSLLLHKYEEVDQSVINLLHGDCNASQSIFLLNCSWSVAEQAASGQGLRTRDAVECKLK